MNRHTLVLGPALLLTVSSVFLQCDEATKKVQRSTIKHTFDTIYLSNYEEVEFQNRTLTIGTPWSHYIKGQKVQLFIKGLPHSSIYEIQLNGQKEGIIQPNGDWMHEVESWSTGIKKQSIIIIDKTTNAKFRHNLDYEVGYLEPFFETGYGDYLVKGIPAELRIRRLGVSCPSIKIKAKGGKAKQTAMGYQVIPDPNASAVILTLQYNGKSYTKEFPVIDPPPPHLSFVNANGQKCIELDPNGMYPNISYKIDQITGYSLEDSADFINIGDPCFEDHDNTYIRSIMYSIEETGYIDTLILN